MIGRIMGVLLPANQRRTVDELTADLDFGAGDVRAKRSAFWTMLTLSAIIASVGVLADSTATVIGAMIIAPLSTPILGVGLGIAKRDPALTRRSVLYVALGAALAIGVGTLFSFTIPASVSLLSNAQISGRTSPGLTDLIAALATGAAGAVAMSRRDVAAVLPGVAIAISLVPPLAVAGECLGKGAFALAFGAILLFISNALALVLIGALVFTVVVRDNTATTPQESRRKTYLALSLLMLVILIPLLANTATTVLLTVWSARVTSIANEWAAQAPGTVIQGVDVRSSTIHVHVLAPGDIPDPADLMTRLDGQIPNGVTIVLDTSYGKQIPAGVVGG